MKQLLILGVLSFLLTTLLAQEYDGNVELNTAAQVSSMIPFVPEAAVSLVVPQAKVAGFTYTTNGVVLYGENLAPDVPAVVEIPGGNLIPGVDSLKGEITWRYTGERLADSSGFVINLEINITWSSPATQLPRHKSVLMLNSNEMDQLFKHRQYSMYQALYGTQWFYDWVNSNYASPLFQSVVYMNGIPYAYYKNDLRIFKVFIGDPIVKG